MLRGASPSSPWAWLSHDGWTPGPLAVKPQLSEPCGETGECHVEEEARGTHLGTRQASAWFPLCSPLPGDSPSLRLLPPSVKVWSWLCLCPLHRRVLTITVSGLCLELIGICACINPRNFSCSVMPFNPVFSETSLSGCPTRKVVICYGEPGSPPSLSQTQQLLFRSSE